MLAATGRSGRGQCLADAGQGRWPRLQSWGQGTWGANVYAKGSCMGTLLGMEQFVCVKLF